MTAPASNPTASAVGNGKGLPLAAATSQSMQPPGLHLNLLKNGVGAQRNYDKAARLRTLTRYVRNRPICDCRSR